MKAVTILLRCFLYIMLCTLSKADVKTQRYTMDASLDNKVSNVSLVAIYHSESLIQCSSICCGERCACFGFNPQLQKCRIYQSCDPAHMTIIETGWENFFPDGCGISLNRSCMEILECNPNVKGEDGLYSINIDDQEKKVYCDMTTDGGGWTVIQKRQDNSTDFQRNWTDYKNEFGDPSKNYWIGNDAIHYLTNINQELRVELLSFDDEKAYALYSTFQVGNESSKYRLTVTGYSGTAGNSLEYCNGGKFSTRDQDNDERRVGNCANHRHGAWWYRDCGTANLNGKYAGPAVTGHHYLIWAKWKFLTPLKGALMQIRPTKKHPYMYIYRAQQSC